jgi:hypothetical protein
MSGLSNYRAVWCVDFEFTIAPGGLPMPICCVGCDVISGRLERAWLADGGPVQLPFSGRPNELFVSYSASAESSCLLSLNQPLPSRVLDLYAEFRNLTCGRPIPPKHRLLDALIYFGLPPGDAVEKSEMRQLAIRGAPFTDRESVDLLDYCQRDVDALVKLLPVMMRNIDLPRALLRGRYMCAVARMERVGVPIDVAELNRIQGHWEHIKGRLIDAVDPHGEVFVSKGRQPNPKTPAGAAILAVANENRVDPGRLMDAADWLYHQDRAAVGELAEAVKAARKETGLTETRLARWERDGGDDTTWPGLDAAARALAKNYPALVVGAAEGTYAARLWKRLRETTPSVGLKYADERLRRAVGRLDGDPNADKSNGPRSWSNAKFATFLERRGLLSLWPRLASGALELSEKTFADMARSYPEVVSPFRELRNSLSQLRLNKLTIGPDGRNRVSLMPFGSTTGRNQPSNSRYVFGPSVWMRHLIRPGPGRFLFYADWEQQEFGTAAALSGDRRMREAYQSGDPYLTFAKQAGAVPADATKASHRAEREVFKTCVLAVQYGMGAEGLARRLNVRVCRARELLGLFYGTYHVYAAWSDAVEDKARLTGRLSTVFGWTLRVGSGANPRSLRNFPMQAHGAEMLRLACCLMTERGIQVCAPVHDAVLVEGPADEAEHMVAATEAAMREASMTVLSGFALRTEVKVVRYPTMSEHAPPDRLTNHPVTDGVSCS